ncbi:putative transmembrane ascorbate ferrireductase 4 [Drosera capensis]
MQSSRFDLSSLVPSVDYERLIQQQRLIENSDRTWRETQFVLAIVYLGAWYNFFSSYKPVYCCEAPKSTTKVLHPLLMVIGFIVLSGEVLEYLHFNKKKEEEEEEDEKGKDASSKVFTCSVTCSGCDSCASRCDLSNLDLDHALPDQIGSHSTPVEASRSRKTPRMIGIRPSSFDDDGLHSISRPLSTSPEAPHQLTVNLWPSPTQPRVRRRRLRMELNSPLPESPASVVGSRIRALMICSAPHIMPMSSAWMSLGSENEPVLSFKVANQAWRITVAILVHRWLPGSGNLKKSAHLCMQGIAFGSGVFGIWTKFHGDNGIAANFNSLHSWMGLICVLLFGSQVSLHCEYFANVGVNC